MAEIKSYDELVQKHSIPAEEKAQAKASQNAATALRKKKSSLRAKIDQATDAVEVAKEQFELAVVNQNVTSFDVEYLALKTAEETEKMYKELYAALFGKVPE